MSSTENKIGILNCGGGWTVKDFLGYRGLLAIIIVADHLSQEMLNPGVIKIFSWTGYIVVSIFFAISGFGLSVQTLKRSDYLDNFIRGRLPKIFIPFWISNCIYVLIEALIYKKSMNIFLFTGYILGYPQINTNAWYVLALFAMYIAFYISVKFICKGNIKKAIFWIVLMTIAWSLFCLIIIKRYWWMNAVYAFTVGICIHEYQDKFKEYFREIFHVAIFICMFFVTFTGGWLITNFYISLICMIAASITSSMLFFWITERFKMRNKVAGFFGVISYELYLIHNLFRILFKSKIYIASDLLYYIVVLGTSILAAGFIHLLSETVFKIKFNKGRLINL